MHPIFSVFRDVFEYLPEEKLKRLLCVTGHETKTMMNNSGPRYKRSKLERRANTDILWCVLLLILMCLIGALGK